MSKIYFDVTYKVKHGKRDAFLKAIIGEKIDISVRNENGNIKYDYYYPVNDDDTLCLMEQWENMEDIEHHMQTEHMKRLGSIKAEYVNETIIKKYNISER